MGDKRLRKIVPFARCMNTGWLANLTGQQTIFPFYHVVSDQDLPHIKHLYSYLSESGFEKDLDAMLRYFDPISIEDYLEDRQVSGKKRRMVLSFDDGLAECHQFIAPLLKSKGVPAIFFLNNDFIDNRGLFYRYKASILVDYLIKNPVELGGAAEFLAIPEEQVRDAILMISYRQAPLLDAIALHVGLDFALYLRDQPVYMSTGQVNHLVKLGFHLGAHSMDHPEFYNMEEKRMVAQVNRSMTDLSERFKVDPATFAFPFTSDGIPQRVIHEIQEEGIARVIFGTAGLKKTGNVNYIQRIPMESGSTHALDQIRAEYLYYLMKEPFGRNHYFKGSQYGAV